MVSRSVGMDIHVPTDIHIVPETHPPLTVQCCTKSGCQLKSKSVVIDAHSTSGYINCYTQSIEGRVVNQC